MNPSTTTLDLNVGYPNIATICHAVQGDALSRIIEAHLYDGGVAWTPPAGAVGIIKFHTALGTSGMYDTDEEGNTAVTWSGNVATLRIVQNALAVPGDVPMQLTFYDANNAVLTTFLWETLVQPSVLTDTQFMQTDYYNILSQQIAAIITAISDIPTPSTANPEMDGTASPGSSDTYSRGDHVHPTDTSRAQKDHASTGTTYGKGTDSNYGHVKLSDSTSSTAGTSDGTAATPKAVKDAYDKADGKPDLSSTATDIKVNGTQSAGSSTKAARADHVHPITSLGALGLGYGTCTTAESTTAKEATLVGFNLSEGAMPTIKFTYNVPAGAKLNINSTGSKNIYISSAGMLVQITAGIIKAGDYVTFVYNGSQYVVQSIFRQVKEISNYGNITSLSIEEVSS